MVKKILGKEEFSHTYVVCRFNQCIVIDPSHDMPAILEAVGHKEIVAVLLTHAHDDHIDLIGHFDCPIYIHQDDAYLLFENKYNGYIDRKRPFHKKDLTLVLLKDEDKVPLSDQFVKVIHTPGHTKGSLCYLYQNHLFTGDTLFKSSVGRHDLFSGSLPLLKRSVLKIMLLNNQIKVYPGHDEMTSIRDEKKNNPFYKKWYKQFNKS